MPDPRERRSSPIVPLLTTGAGVVLLIWLIVSVGSTEIWSGLRQIGWGFTIIVLLGGLRFATRAMAWRLCLEPPHWLSFRHALGAVIAGDALGNVMPLGPIISEPTKAAFVRSRVPLAAAITALAVENVIYTLTVAAMIAAGMIALLFQFELPGVLREISEAALAGVAMLFVIALWMLWRQPALLSRALAILAPRGQHTLGDRIRTLEREVYSFARRRGSAIAPLLAAEMTFHTLGVVEAHVTLWMLGYQPSLLTSFIVETVNRLITVVFKFIPSQIGVNEAGTALLTQVLGLGAATGTTLGIVRKIRMLCWTMVGTLLFFRHGLSVRRVLRQAELSASPGTES